MQNSKLALLFQSLNKKEIRSLRKFLRSPFFNQREDVIHLFDYLANNAERENNPPERKEAYSYVFSDKPYDDALLNSIMHFLYLSVKEFLAFQEIRRDETNWQLQLCRSLRKRKLDKLFKQEMRKLEKKQSKQRYRNVGYHYHNYQLELERYEYQHKQQRSGRKNLEELASELTIFYLADILRHSCTVLTAQNMSPQLYKLELLDQILEYVEKSPLLATPAVAIYHQAYKALSSSTEENTAFEKLENLIEEHWEKFPAAEAMDIYLLAINYCIQRLNRGDRSYIKKAFELYKRGLEREVLLDHGTISKFTYKNVLMLSIALQEWDWSAQFLDTYKAFLPAKERENIYLYNLAILYFRKPDYDKAMHLLQRVTFQDVLYNLNARTMLLQIYFELEEYDALESLLDSFSAFLRRHKELGYHKANYVHLISFVKQLLSIPTGDFAARIKLKNQIEATPSLAEKKWLMNQI